MGSSPVQKNLCGPVEPVCPVSGATLLLTSDHWKCFQLPAAAMGGGAESQRSKVVSLTAGGQCDTAGFRFFRVFTRTKHLTVKAAPSDLDTDK